MGAPSTSEPLGLHLRALGTPPQLLHSPLSLEELLSFNRVSAPTAMAASQSSSYGDAAMDATLWGELQSYVDLAMIYVKLPLAPFFRLRQVCKEWNRLASDRQFLERTFKSPDANPFFFVTIRGRGHRLFTYQASSWSSMPLPRVKCEVSGLLCEDSFEHSDRIRIFDLHTRVFHTLPPIPMTVQAPLLPVEEEDDYDDPLVGMTVDTTLIPYSFRVILADEVIGTRIYDSKSGAWTQKPSTHEYCMTVDRMPSCVYHNQFLYIKVLGVCGANFDLHAYDLQRDEWNCETPGVPEDVREFRGIGLWRERLFAFGLKFPAVAVWEIGHRLEEQWTLFDSMPKELRAWIVSGKDSNLEYIQTKFCNEHVLLYNYVAGEEKAVLYNLDQKTWEKVALPALPGRHQQLLQ